MPDRWQRASLFDYLLEQPMPLAGKTGLEQATQVSIIQNDHVIE